MKFAIMQPYFFPYIGYFELIYRSDFWIVFDTPQFIQQGWIHRNRILHPREGWQFIVVPRKRHPHTARICEIVIAEDEAWRERILGQIGHYKRRAPFYKAVRDLVIDCLYGSFGSLSELNVKSLEKVTAYLGIPFRYAVFSQMEISSMQFEDSTDRAIKVARILGATEYINPPGGAHLFDRDRFEEAGIKLTIQKPVDFVYDCDGYTFEPNLSIIDVMMWNSPDSITRYLESRSQEGI